MFYSAYRFLQVIVTIMDVQIVVSEKFVMHLNSYL